MNLLTLINVLKKYFVQKYEKKYILQINWLNIFVINRLLDFVCDKKILEIFGFKLKYNVPKNNQLRLWLQNLISKTALQLCDLITLNENIFTVQQWEIKNHTEFFITQN